MGKIVLNIEVLKELLAYWSSVFVSCSKDTEIPIFVPNEKGEFISIFNLITMLKYLIKCVNE